MVELGTLEVEPSASALLRAGKPTLRTQAMEGMARDSEIGGRRASVEPTITVRLGAGRETRSEARDQPLSQPIEVVVIKRGEEGGR